MLGLSCVKNSFNINKNNVIPFQRDALGETRIVLNAKTRPKMSVRYVTPAFTSDLVTCAKVSIEILFYSKKEPACIGSYPTYITVTS